MADEAVLETRAPGGRSAAFDRLFSLHVEMGIIALVLLAWQAVRIPFEASVPDAVAHAHDWLAAEATLHVDVESDLIRLLHRPVLIDLLGWGYGNFHIPALLAFMATVRLAAPRRYAKLRSAFVIAHLPAIAILALYPLAPPQWLPEIPFAKGPPTPAEASSLGETLRNATAASVSMHFGIPLLIAGTALWLAPRSRLAWLTLLYPPLVFLIVVGTGNHYVLDLAAGVVCIAVGVVAAQLLHGPTPLRGRSAGARAILRAAALWALVGFTVNAAATGHLYELAVAPLVAAAWLVVNRRRA